MDKFKKWLNDMAVAIKEKTGESKIKPITFPEKIRTIETGADVSGVTATAADVLQGKTIVDADGNAVEGTMKDNGYVSEQLTPSKSYINLNGYYTGGVSVKNTRPSPIVPTKSQQDITARSIGAFIDEIVIQPIPDEYQNVTNVTATAEDVRAGKVFVDAEGNEVHGTFIEANPGETVVFKLQRVSGFVSEDELYAWSPGYVSPAAFVLEKGKRYRVNWDGEDYTCTAFTFERSGYQITAIGDASRWGEPGNAEPFLFTYNASLDNTKIYSLGDWEAHIIGIYQEASEGGSDVEHVIWFGSSSGVAGSLAGSGIIRYVTFKNHDGTVEYGRKSVIQGENCVDPVTAGHMDTPTRESTAQYSYTFSGGWATEPNGGKNTNALKAVDEDRTVYANFVSALRYYTITFYDSDGTTVLATKSVAYGSMPEYVPPSKTGYTFDGWDRPLEAVVSDASYVAQWTESPAIKAVATIESVSAFGDMALFNNTYRISLSKPSSEYTGYHDDYYKLDTTPTQSNQSFGTYVRTRAIAVRYDDKVLTAIGSDQAASNWYLVHQSYAAGIANTYEQLQSYSGSDNETTIVYSPISEMFAYTGYKSGAKIYLSTGRTISASGKKKVMAICKNDEYIVYGGASGGVVVYSTSGGKVATLSSNNNATSISVSADGLKVVVAYSTSPYVAVYNMETLTEICKLNTHITASSYAAFVGDLVVVATGSKVRAFKIVDSTPVEYYGIPTYSGGSISKIAVSHNCNRLALYDGTDITVWEKA